MNGSPYHDRDRNSHGDRNRDHRRADDDDDSYRNNKRRHEDQRDDRDNKRPKQDYHDKRDRRPQPPQDSQFRNSNHNKNKKQERGNSGDPHRNKNQINVIKEDNRRLKAELNALKASIAQGDIKAPIDNTTSAQLSHSDAVAQLPPSEGILTDVALYTPFTVPNGLPQLPAVASEDLRSAVFKHKSIYPQHREGADGIVTYEKLEYLGDAYLELFASRLIYHRFPRLTASQMSQARETLVKNDTLAHYSRAYGFDAKVEVDKGVKAGMDQDKSNKGFNKILGDVFESYVAAVILSHEDGFAAAEKWLTALWAPKMLELYHAHKTLLVHPDDADPLTIYSPNAVQELSNRVGNGRSCKLEYKALETIELKGDHLGQNLWIMELYLTGYGYSSELLARGQGASQKEGKVWAAVKAMHGKTKSIIKECESKRKELAEQQKAQHEAQDKHASDTAETAS